MRRWLLILCLCLAAPFAFAQGNYPFCEGETVTLSVMYKWGAINTEVGTARLQVDSLEWEGQPAYHLTARAWTVPFFDRIYKIRENLQSWVRASDLRPLRFTRSTYEGGYEASNEFNYNWEEGRIEADVTFDKKPPQKLQIPLKSGEYDLIALLYHMRRLDESSYQDGATTHIRFAIDDNVFDVYIKGMGKENLKIRRMGRRLNAWHLSCSVVQGALFDGNENLHLWISADENRIPVAARVPLKLGAVQAWISGWNGLKNPFDAWTDERKR